MIGWRASGQMSLAAVVGCQMVMSVVMLASAESESEGLIMERLK